MYDIDNSEGEDSQVNANEGGDINIEIDNREWFSLMPPLLTPSTERHPPHAYRNFPHYMHASNHLQVLHMDIIALWSISLVLYDMKLLICDIRCRHTTTVKLSKIKTSTCLTNNCMTCKWN